MTNENETIVENRVYEISYILVPTLSEEDSIKKAESFEKSIATLGGSFISKEEPYMRDLAYEMIRVIKNQNNRFVTGYFGWVKFELDPSKIIQLDKQLKLDEEVIRYIAVKADRDVNIITKKSVTKKPDTSNEDMKDIDTASEEDVNPEPATEESASKEVVKESDQD